ncbi:GLPGLI family protein [Aquirufa salirivi]|uniref:GLPGLI family protein n=1 Tax=Aquirufa salirivi TaxID=3104729 RepID=A0ABW8RUJ0_9BACT
MKTIFLLLSILNSFFLIAQEDWHIINYDNYVPYTSMKLNYLLVTGNKVSYYFNVPKGFKANPEILKKYISPIRVIVVKRSFENEIITKEFNPENSDEVFYIKENLEGLVKWEIQNEKKQILGYTCQKAISNFRGRRYVAHFSSKLPISDGPFKYFNLPGLILEVYSTDGFVKFSANSITKEHLKIDASSFEQLKPKYISYESFKFQLAQIMAEKSKKYNSKASVDADGIQSSVSFGIERIEKD